MLQLFGDQQVLSELIAFVRVQFSRFDPFAQVQNKRYKTGGKKSGIRKNSQNLHGRTQP